MNLAPVKQHRSRKGEYFAARTHSVIYYAEEEGKKKVQACKKPLFGIHDTTSKRMQRLISLLKAGRSPKDGRGTNVNRRTNAMSPEVCEQVAQHIESFDVKEAHYSSS
ncbi:hypothetical protein PR048_020445 [Dryococelus australis]|uniref:Uncharacterized protein n=1 Tax=Dryococelus australis TaxID=614101 RepID=A0ABQ9H6A3_9NEOP|nr:hypothetical protein PR048_020445 [Dryococelus australis]